MAGYSAEWSEETYRLDEVGHKCSLPQVIQVTEGIYTSNEVDSFSAGDILKIDQCVQLQKVVAQVAKTPVKPTGRDSEYDFLKEVILIPLNYKGKLKVIIEKKKYNTVRELATDLPQYAEFLQALTVSVEDGKCLNIAAGTKVELDRVRLGPDRLIMRTTDGGRRQVEVLLSKRCQFRSTQDETEYTLTEMIERYQLPQTIQFLDSRVEQSDTQDPLEELGQTVTVPVSVLRINKIVSQTVLIGHYSEPDTHKRTIVVVPLDSPETKEIPVKLYEGVEDYPDVGQLLLEKLGSALTKGPYNCTKLTRVSEDILDAGNKISKDTEAVAPPPVPRRLQRRKSEEPPMIAPRGRKVEGNAPPVPPRPRTMGETSISYRAGQYDEEYEECKALGLAPPPPNAGTSSASSSTVSPQRSPTTPTLGTFSFTKGKKDTSKEKGAAQTPKTEVSNSANPVKNSGSATKEKDEEYDTDGSHYDEIDESRLDNGNPLQAKETKRRVAHVSPQVKCSGGAFSKSPVKHQDEPLVTQTEAYQAKLLSEKEFYQLNIEELQERLIKNGLDKFAKFCFDERLNGAFFDSMNEEKLKTLKLSPSDKWKLRKLIQGHHPDTHL